MNGLATIAGIQAANQQFNAQQARQDALDEQGLQLLVAGGKSAIGQYLATATQLRQQGVAPDDPAMLALNQQVEQGLGTLHTIAESHGLTDAYNLVANSYQQAKASIAATPTAEQAAQQAGQLSRTKAEATLGHPLSATDAQQAAGFEVPPSVREAEALGYDLRTAEGRAGYGIFKQMQTRPPAGTTIINKLGPEAAKNPWTDRGMKRVGELDTELGQAQSMLPEFREARKAIENGAYTGLDAPSIGVNTPWGVIGVDVQPEMVSGLRLLTALGLVDPGRMAQTERLQQLQNRLAPLVRPPGSGSTSDFEAQMYLQAVPNLMTTKEGNLLLIDGYEKLVDRKRQEMAILEGMIEDGSYSPSKYLDRVTKLGKVFSKDEQGQLEQAQLASKDTDTASSIPAETSQPGATQSTLNRSYGVPLPTERKVGQTYHIGSQDLTWTGHGWVPATK
jgi:hypothetical protein